MLLLNIHAEYLLPDFLPSNVNFVITFSFKEIYYMPHNLLIFTEMLMLNI